MSDLGILDGDKTCYLCHQPIRFYDPVHYHLDADGIMVEVHAACWERMKGETP